MPHVGDMQRHIVKPMEPTVLAGRAEYTLKNFDLWLGFKVDTAHVVPGPIDLDRFNDALSKALSVYPLFAGRMKRSQQDREPWKVLLTNDGIPVTIIDSDADAEVPQNHVIQNPFTLSQPIQIPRLWDVDSKEPLLRITITRFTKLGSTSVALSGTHALGDAFTYLSFIRHLSQFYQGLPPIDASPDYNQPPSCSHDPEKYGPIPLPDLDNPYTIHEPPPFARSDRVKAQRVDLYLTPEQIAQIQNGVRKQAPSLEEGKKISRQDALIALLAYSAAKVDPDCLPDRICNVVNDRGFGSRPATAMTNSLIWAVTDRAASPGAETTYSIARRIRHSIERVRDPEYAAAWDAAHIDKMLDIVNADMSSDFTPGPGSWVVNSTWRFDWTSAHFGYEGRTRFFHTLLDEPRYIKMFQLNPIIGVDGTVQRPPGIESTFYLHKEVKEKFKLVLVEELLRLGVTGEYRCL